MKMWYNSLIRWLTGRDLQLLLMDNAQRVEFPGEPHTERGFLHFSREVRYRIRLGLDRQLGRRLLVASPSFLRAGAAAWERAIQREPWYHRLNVRAWDHRDT